MGDIETTRVDVGALQNVADRYDAVADVVDGLMQTHMVRLIFDGALAGRDYLDRGDALRRAVDDVAHALQMWSRSSREISTALRSSGDSYVEVDARGAARLR